MFHCDSPWWQKQGRSGAAPTEKPSQASCPSWTSAWAGLHGPNTVKSRLSDKCTPLLLIHTHIQDDVGHVNPAECTCNEWSAQWGTVLFPLQLMKRWMKYYIEVIIWPIFFLWMNTWFVGFIFVFNAVTHLSLHFTLITFYFLFVLPRGRSTCQQPCSSVIHSKPTGNVSKTLPVFSLGKNYCTWQRVCGQDF